VPDEQHDLPLTALCAALSHGGVPATLLGAATPTATLAQAVVRRRPAAVVVLAVLPELADPEAFDGLPDTDVLIAAGPGWIDADLPSAVHRLDDLDEAVELVVDAAGPEARSR
jgi:hypothetical protein